MVLSDTDDFLPPVCHLDSRFGRTTKQELFDQQHLLFQGREHRTEGTRDPLRIQNSDVIKCSRNKTSC